jgi:GNAT superfamily N-acetyltransferase
MQISIRDVPQDEIRAESEAVRWVLSSWLRSYAHAARELGQLRGRHDPVYWTDRHNITTGLLRRSRLVLAHLPDEPDLFVGWACATPGLLHYVYVKLPYQRMGVARRLLESVSQEPVSRYTHAGPRALMQAATDRGWSYCPHLINRG